MKECILKLLRENLLTGVNVNIIEQKYINCPNVKNRNSFYAIPIFFCLKW